MFLQIHATAPLSFDQNHARPLRPNFLAPAPALLPSLEILLGLRLLFGRGMLVSPKGEMLMKKNAASIAMALALVFGLAPLAARAQQNPVSSAVRTTVSRQAKNLTGSAEEMPADKYGFKPTAEQMSFGHLVLHVAESNMFLCSRISGEKAPALPKLTETSPKASLVSAVESSFSFCDGALAKVNDSELTQEVPFFGGRKISKAAAMIGLTNDLADHYSQAAMYLRLNGKLPPTAQHRRM